MTRVLSRYFTQLHIRLTWYTSIIMLRVPTWLCRYLTSAPFNIPRSQYPTSVDSVASLLGPKQGLWTHVTTLSIQAVNTLYPIPQIPQRSIKSRYSVSQEYESKSQSYLPSYTENKHRINVSTTPSNALKFHTYTGNPLSYLVFEKKHGYPWYVMVAIETSLAH